MHGLLGRETGEGRRNLIGDIRLGQVMLALRMALADADDRRDAVFEQDLRLGIDLQVGLAVVAAALTVADDAVLRAEVAELLGGHLAGERAVLVFGHVLCADTEAAALPRRLQRGNERIRRADDHVAAALSGKIGLQLLREGRDLGHALIELPVAGNDCFSLFQIHVLCFLSAAYLSSRHATPGSSLPSRNSSEAPPPVEMCVILSA